MLQVVLADNPSPLTGPGTNTFLLGEAEVAVIDPGPDDPAHRAAILAAAPGPVVAILVTHAHRDHSAGAAALAAATGAPVCGFGRATEGRAPHLAALADIGGVEGLDADFAPDRRLRDGDVVAGTGWRLEAIHTPGHSAGHLAFRWGEAVLCGDLVLGWASTLISPPDGDLGDYMRSLARLAALAPRRLWPAHGAAVDDPQARIAALAAHRRERTAQILAALADGPADAATLARRLYDVPAALLPAAERNVFAHLLALAELGAVAAPVNSPGDAFMRAF